MALGIASAACDTLLDYYTATIISTPFIKLHTASPGTGSTAAATETTRKAITFAASSGGTKANSVAITWTSVAGSETYSHFSLWTASSAGTFEGSGTVTANAVTAGDTFTIAISGLTLALSVAA